MTAVQTMQLQQPALTPIGEQHLSLAAACSGFDTPPQTMHVIYDDVPTVVHASEQKFLKSEDVVFVRSVAPVLGDVHSMFIVCDGHMGVGAAQHCVTNMPRLLSQLLPQHLPDWTVNSEVEAYAEKVRRAISTATVLLDNDWARLNDSAGTTLTMAVLSGWLLTIANTGDSNAIVDCGDDVQEITFSHRIQVNKAEQARLREAGAQLAPVGFHLQGPAKPQEMGVGPLRMWPGGLCVSRSIGDLDAGPLIVPLPHVRQVIMNRSRALRLIMASDGLWDLMSFSKAAKSVRHKLPTAAVEALIQMAVRDRRMSDDVSIIIADVLPPAAPGATPQQFPAAALKVGTSSSRSSSSNTTSRSSSGGGLFGCFKAPPVQHEPPPDITPPQPSQPSPQRLSMDLRNTFQHGLARLSGRAGGGMRRPGPPAKPWIGLQWYADVDCFEAYPMHTSQLMRKEVSQLPQRPKTPPKGADFTVHGGNQAHRFQQDSSWHATPGSSRHGESSEMPLLLSQAQLDALHADGPAAAASMIFSDRPQQQQQQESLYGNGFSSGSPKGLYEQQRKEVTNPGLPRGPPPAAAAAGSSGVGGSTYAATAPHVMSSSKSVVLPTVDIPRSAAAAAGDGSGLMLVSSGPSRTEHSLASIAAASASGPASPSPTALARSASAQFEHDGSTGVYVAAEDGGQGLGAPGRVQPASEANVRNHFGSAPEVVAQGHEGRVHSGRGALAAAAAADEGRPRQHGFGMGI